MELKEALKIVGHMIEGNEKLINMSKKYEGVNEINEPYFPSPYKKMWEQRNLALRRLVEEVEKIGGEK